MQTESNRNSKNYTGNEDETIKKHLPEQQETNHQRSRPNIKKSKDQKSAGETTQNIRQSENKRYRNAKKEEEQNKAKEMGNERKKEKNQRKQPYIPPTTNAKSCFMKK